MRTSACVSVVPLPELSRVPFSSQLGRAERRDNVLVCGFAWIINVNAIVTKVWRRPISPSRPGRERLAAPSEPRHSSVAQIYYRYCPLAPMMPCTAAMSLQLRWEAHAPIDAFWTARCHRGPAPSGWNTQGSNRYGRSSPHLRSLIYLINSAFCFRWFD